MLQFSVFKMPGSFFVLFTMIVVMFAINSTETLNTVDNQTPDKTKTCKKAEVCNCTCNLTINEGSYLNVAIKNLEKQLENLIKHNKETRIKLESVIGLVNETCTLQPKPPAVPAASCKELYERNKSSKSKVYALKFGSQKIPVYCHMGNFGCGDGGWTLAMKIDGNKKTFRYSSHFWSNKNSHNIEGGKTGFDSQETKLPSYWNTSFSKICLGMKIGQQIKFVSINQDGNSLHALIADGSYRATSLGRAKWKSLIGSKGSLQYHCSKEGFNALSQNTVYSKARIGILGNNYPSCGWCDSRIGFGTEGHPDDSNTCGNEAVYSPDNGNRHIKAMGYILVQ